VSRGPPIDRRDAYPKLVGVPSGVWSRQRRCFLENAWFAYTTITYPSRIGELSKVNAEEIEWSTPVKEFEVGFHARALQKASFFINLR
jgi:hypothetical protein